MDKKEIYFTVFFPYFQLFDLILLPTDTVFGDFGRFRDFYAISVLSIFWPSSVKLFVSCIPDYLQQLQTYKPINRPYTAYLRAFRRFYATSGGITWSILKVKFGHQLKSSTVFKGLLKYTRSINIWKSGIEVSNIL